MIQIWESNNFQGQLLKNLPRYYLEQYKEVGVKSHFIETLIQNQQYGH